MQRTCIFLLILSATTIGCASSKAPDWHAGFLDSLADYYDQGTGTGASIDRADRNAQISLVGFQQGIRVENVIEDNIQSFEKNGESLSVEIVTSKGVQKIDGSLPPGAYIAERWKDEHGNWWSYAVAERPGQSPRIQQLRNDRLTAARVRAIVPAWAQFTKSQRTKGWRILGLGGVGLVGGVTFSILQIDAEDRRDRSRNATDHQHYDDQANNYYWASVGFSTLAGVAYLYSLVDGITSVPPTYQLLLSRVEVQPQASGLALLYRHELK